MKIIYHHRTRGEDAQGIHIKSIQNAWKDLGHDVLEVSVGKSDAAPRQATAASRHSEGRSALGSLIYEAMSIGYNAYGYTKLVSAIRQFQPDLIYERYCLNLMAGVAAANRFGIPFVLEANSPLVDEMKAASGLYGTGIASAIERYVLKRATKVVVVTDVLKRHYTDQGYDPDKFEVIQNGIDPKLFNEKVDPSDVRAKFGLAGKCVIGFVGWARQWHRLDLLVDAFANLQQRENYAVLICGDGPAIPELREKAAQMGLAQSVHFAGALDHSQIPAHVAAMDITVLPSIPVYASPMKLFEYMAMGKAVVVPDQPNLREVVEDGVNGVLIPKADPQGLATAVNRVALDSALRSKVSQEALETIHKGGYFWTQNARRVLQGVGLE